VTLNTPKGAIAIKVEADLSPIAAGNFVALASCGFYDGTVFHRVVPKFVIQGGDPTGTGNGGPGYSVREKPPAGLRYSRGVVAMAKTEIEPAGTSGSQFFIVTAEDAGLPADYALLGKVTKGDDVVSKIAATPTDSTEHPTKPVVITKATIR